MLSVSFQVQKTFVVSRYAEPVGNNETAAMPGLLLFTNIAISGETESTSNALALFTLHLIM